MTDLREIPNFPESRELIISDAPLINDLFKKYPPLISEHTFTNLFAWMPKYRYRISKKENLIVIISMGVMIYPPIGEYTGADLAWLLADLKKEGLTEGIQCVAEDTLKLFDPFKDELTIEHIRDHDDYIYKREDLVNLPGNRFHDKKNLLQQFKKYKTSFEMMTTSNVEEAISFQHEWCRTRECEKDPGLTKEECAIVRMLSHFEILKYQGALIRHEGKIIAVTLGEPLTEDTYVIHVEKGNGAYRGIYQFINQRFAETIDSKYKWINREQDMGIPGLRRAKESYNPAKMGKKYAIKIKD